MDYFSRNHSKYLIMAHLIFVCKYRKHLLSKYGNQVKQILNDIAEEKDHIHLLVSYKPTQSILDVVRLLKQMSTYRIWRQNDNRLYLTKQLWNEKTFWSDGYFACSIGNVSKETIEKYIQSQG